MLPVSYVLICMIHLRLHTQACMMQCIHRHSQHFNTSNMNAPYLPNVGCSVGHHSLIATDVNWPSPQQVHELDSEGVNMNVAEAAGRKVEPRSLILVLWQNVRWGIVSCKQSNN